MKSTGSAQRLKTLEAEPLTTNRETLTRKVTQQIAKLEGELNHHATWVYRYQLLKAKVIRHMPEDRFTTVVWLLAAVVVGLAIKGVFEFFHETLVGSVTNRSLFDLRNAFFRRAIHQDVRQLAETGTPELMARFTNDTEQIAIGLKVLYGRMVGEPLKAIGCLVAACYISIWLTAVFIVIVPLAIYVLVRVSKMMRKAARKLLERMSAMYKLVRETFDSNRAVKAFTQEPHERRRFRVASREYFRKAMRVIYIDAATGPIVEILVVSAIGFALASGTYLVVTQKTDIFGYQMIDEPLGFATLLQLYAFLAATADPVRRLTSVYTKIQTGTSAANRIFEIYDRMPTVKANPEGPRPTDVREKIEFRNVCFSYDLNADKPTLSTINLTVHAGETIAIVGGNGSGKTTLLGLLPRFYDPSHGAVLIDGVNVRLMHLRSLRRTIGLVTQDTQLFDDTVYNNIAYGRKGATRDEVIEAARKARAHAFIEKKPEGYETRMGDSGVNFSGGEKQKIALARAILRNPRILILDEFSNQIDTVSEADIHDALKEFVKGRTVFLITHKLHTLEIADRIVVMDGGELIDVGTHAELIARCPRYQLLCDPGSGRKSGDAEPIFRTGAAPTAMNHEIEFQNVSFSYDPDHLDCPTLSKVNLRIKAGETIGIVGDAACGANTLAGLLPRRYDPDFGNVYLDGVNLRTMNLRNLRQIVAFVDRDSTLLDGTVFANIAAGKRSVSRDEVADAARHAHVHDHIELLPHGYDTPVNDPQMALTSTLRMRIVLARTLVRNPSVVVVDATADAEVASLIENPVRGRTLVILARRPSIVARGRPHRCHGCRPDRGRRHARGTHGPLPVLPTTRGLIGADGRMMTFSGFFPRTTAFVASLSAWKKIATERAVLPRALVAVAPFVLVGILCFARLGHRELYSSHEARAAQDAQRMIDTGEWGLPILFDGRNDFQKPPGYYWAVAAIGLVNGGTVNEWVARFPAALSGFLCSLLLYAILRQAGRPRAGVVAMLALATANHYMGIARIARIDIPLTFAVTVSLLAFYRGCVPTRGGSKYRSLIWHVVAVAAASAVMLKGPVGLALIGPAAFAWLVFERWFQPREERPHVPLLSWFLIPLVTAAIALPWFVWANHATGGEFVRVFFWHHTIDRYTGESPQLASHPWWYYVPRFLVDFMPWTPVLNFLAIWSLRMGRWHHDSLFRFATIAFVTIFTVLSTAHFKRADYLLPAFPFAALMLGCAAESWLATRVRPVTVTGVMWLWRATIGVGIVCWLVMLFVVEPAEEKKERRKQLCGDDPGPRPGAAVDPPVSHGVAFTQLPPGPASLHLYGMVRAGGNPVASRSPFRRDAVGICVSRA